jgi:hypothetical protein
VGCHTVQDALHLDLASTVRGLGRKTRIELLNRLEAFGFIHPSLDGQPASEIRVLERSLERMQDRIDKALGIVAKEIGLVKQRLRKTIAMQSRKEPEFPVTSARRPTNNYCRDEK